MSTRHTGARPARRPARAVIATVAALGAAAALAAPAGAVVNGSHIVAVIPQSSTLELTGYPPNAPLTVQAVRNGVVIGHATTDALADGTAGVNPVSCWIGSTPQILPGDTVTVDTPGLPQDSMVVQNITATTMEQAANGHILVHGVAIAPGGGPYDPATFLASVQARVSRPAGGGTFSNGRNTLRAGAGKFDGTIAYDAPGSTNWTADFPLNATDAALALSAKNFEGVFLVGLSELTIGRFPPAAPAAGCPPIQANGVTSLDRSAINIGNNGTPLAVFGAAQPDVTSVSLAVKDATGATRTLPPITPSGGTWTASVDVSGLPEGTVILIPTMTGASGTFGGAQMSIVKDVTAPAKPVASLAPGTYVGARSVTLGDDDATATVHFTTSGAAPGAASPAATAPIALGQSTTIRAIAVDPAGNASGESSFAYTIVAPPTPPAAAAGATTVVQQIAPRTVSVLGARAASPAALRNLSVLVLRHNALRVSVRVGRGVEVVRFRVFRTRGGRRVGSPVATFVRLPTSGRYTVTLSSRALRRLKPGHYVLEAETGAGSSRNAGVILRKAFVID